jgi:hypothetical protein
MKAERACRFCRSGHSLVARLAWWIVIEGVTTPPDLRSETAEWDDWRRYKGKGLSRSPQIGDGHILCPVTRSGGTRLAARFSYPWNDTHTTPSVVFSFCLDNENNP